MTKALKQAAIALKNGEVPVGAVIVDATGKIIARGYNQIEKKACQLGHAEAIAIQKACKKLGDWRLNGCWIYVTLEPCLMCMGLIKLSRITGIVFGTHSNLFGSGLAVLKNAPAYTKGISIEGGCKKQQSIDLLQAFFKGVRKKRKDDQ
mgnify:CR=1 FL=1